MKPCVLLVNPPIYDFSAYDFWLKPYGMLRVAGYFTAKLSFSYSIFWTAITRALRPRVIAAMLGAVASFFLSARRNRPLDQSLAELEFLIGLGVDNAAFYDDALLYQPKQLLKRFLREILKRRLHMNFHAPNALNARFINRELAERMIAAGFKNIYFGFESSNFAWQKKTGGMVYSDELAKAVDHLIRADANRRQLHAHLIVGHPQGGEQDVAGSMEFTNNLGIRVMLSAFSPLPSTPDGETCRRWVDLAELLCHNKTACTIRLLGRGEINRLQNLANTLNRQLITGNLGGPSEGRLGAPVAAS